jgi:hypothetical protein
MSGSAQGAISFRSLYFTLQYNSGAASPSTGAGAGAGAGAASCAETVTALKRDRQAAAKNANFFITDTFQERRQTLKPKSSTLPIRTRFPDGDASSTFTEFARRSNQFRKMTKIAPIHSMTQPTQNTWEPWEFQRFRKAWVESGEFATLSRLLNRDLAIWEKLWG